MPKLNAAAGIAHGANAFVQNFYRGRAIRDQEKLQQNQALVEILIGRAGDENTTYYQRSKALNLIPGLLGIKNMEKPLDQMLGYDKLNEEDFQVGTKERRVNNPIPTKEEISAGTYSSPTRNVSEPVMQKRGNLTPADLKRINAAKADEDDITKQTKLFQIKLDLEKRAVVGTGFKVISENILSDGEYELIMMNDQGEEKRKVIKGMPKTFAIAKLRGQNIPGKLGQLTRMNTIISEYEADPSSHTEAEYAAAKAGLADFEQTGQLKAAQTKSLIQGIEGTKPPTPAMIKDDDRSDNQQQLMVQKDIDEAEAEAKATFTETQEADIEKNRAQSDKEEAEKEFTAIAAKFKPEDKAYIDANRKMIVARDRYNDLETKFGKIKAADIKAKSKLIGAQKRAGLIASQPDEIKYKDLIAAFRASNKEKVEGLTDTQIVQILRNAKRIK